MKNKPHLQILTILLVVFSAFVNLLHAGSGCGNNSPDGPAQKPDPCAEGGANVFSPFTGNAHREIKDIQVWGAVGEFDFAFKRVSNTRLNNMTTYRGRFGQNSG